MSPLLIESDHLSVRVIPEAGGKILSLCGRPGDRDWLWHNPHLPVTVPVYGASYVETMDSGGWDEIFPSVLPDEVSGLTIPDHGDLVGLPWAVLEQESTRLLMEVRTRFASCLFQRELKLAGDRLEVRYLLRNDEDRPIPYLWCAHPLVALEPGMRVHLPVGTRMLVRGGVNLPEVDEFDWPLLPGCAAFDLIPDPSAPGFRPLAVKMFTEVGTVDRVVVDDPSGRGQLEISWDLEQLPSLGLWMNLGAWSGCGSEPYFNVGVEPTTAPFDRPSDACHAGAGRLLAPGDTAGWSIVVRIGVLV